jgi:hypothetical protein
VIKIYINHILESLKNEKYSLLIFDRYELIKGLEQEHYKFYYYFDTEQNLHIYIIPIDYEYAIKHEIKNEIKIDKIDYRILKYVVVYNSQDDSLKYYFPIQEEDRVEILKNYEDFLSQVKYKIQKIS